MIEIIFATNNQNKVDEINSLISIDGLKVISLKQANINIDIEEPFNTLEENSAIKAKTIFELTQKPCFAEDTGLFVEAINGEPGVKSARYAGEQCNDEDNIKLLLLKLKNVEQRNAFFKTVITYIDALQILQFEGICKGEIRKDSLGQKGFGYDPIFCPLGAKITFAQMSMAEKNNYSHRKRAVAKFIDFLKLKLD